jgi:hypothetical protein
MKKKIKLQISSGYKILQKKPDHTRKLCDGKTRKPEEYH